MQVNFADLMQEQFIFQGFHAQQSGIKTELLFEGTSQIPGSVQYNIRRYARPKNWMAEDVGVIHYHFEPAETQNNHLELRFCTIGNMYCRRDQKECSNCKAQASFSCTEKTE